MTEGPRAGMLSNPCSMTDKFPPEELLRMLIDLTVYNRPLRDVQTCLRAGVNPNGSLKQGLRPLHYAAFHDRPDIILLLIKYGADVNQGDDIGYTPLHIAAKHGFLTCAQMLMENGAVVNYCGDPSSEAKEDAKVLALLTVHPLNLAIENNYPAMTELLLQNGANPNQTYFIGHEVSIVPLAHTECLDVLLRYGADPNSYNRGGITPLMRACKQKEEEAIKVLLRHEADVNRTCHPKLDQKRALHYAIMSGSVSITKLLLDAGADTRQPPEFQFPPLEFAVVHDKVDVCCLLLQYGADPNEVNGEGCTPLQLACYTPDIKRQPVIVEMLLEAGADPCFRSEHFSYISPCLNPLVEYLMAFDEHNIGVVRLLLKYGAEVNLTKATGRYQIKDPAGVVSALRKADDDMMGLLLEAAGGRRDREAVRQEGSMPPLTRAATLEVCAQPACLKHQSRVAIRRLLRPPRPRHIDLLPLPPYIKDYLLFAVK